MLEGLTASPIAPSPSSSAPGLRVETVADVGSFLAPETPWNLLLREAGLPYPFLRHEWVRTWWECFGGDRQLRILLVKAGGHLIGLAPLMRPPPSFTRRMPPCRSPPKHSRSEEHTSELQSHLNLLCR